MSNARLQCPQCTQPVAANPLGKWFSKFACPHCGANLQFDAVTNLLGAAGFAAFFVMVNALLMDWGREAAIPAGIAWVLLVGASYGLRRVVGA